MSILRVEILPDALKAIRSSSHISQSDLAHKAGISVGYIGMIELGQRKPRPNVVSALADALGVPLTAIAHVTEDPS